MASRLMHACVVFALVASAAGCKGKLYVEGPPTGSDGGTGGGPGTFEFEPVSARVYVAKVKNLMLGLPPAEEEIAAVEQDPTALRGLVDAWFVRPEAQAKLFSRKSFRERSTQHSLRLFGDTVGFGNVIDDTQFGDTLG